MKSTLFSFLTKVFIFVFISLTANRGVAQEGVDFWKKVRFGGGLGLGMDSGLFSATMSPSAIYDFNEIFSAGLGIHGTYASQKNQYSSFTYGGNATLLLNPIREMQLSADLEQSNINIDYESKPGLSQRKDSYWVTALYLGAGFRTQNVTVGVKYNVLHDDKKNVSTSAFMPFVRAYF